MASTQLDHLVRIGHEGFDRRSSSGRLENNRHHQNNQQQLVYYGPQVSTMRMPVIISNSYEIAQYYCSGTDTVREPVIFSDEAMKIHGGFVTMDYGRRYPFHSTN